MKALSHTLLLVCSWSLATAQIGTCNKPLGMASGEIPDSGILVSSEAPSFEKQKMRYGMFDNVTDAAWCPLVPQNAWVEIHLPKEKSVSRIEFQLPASGGSPHSPNAFMTRFNMEFVPYFGEEKYILFKENIESVINGTIPKATTLILDPAIVTNTLRIEPKDYQSSPCFRMEIFGCDIKDLCPEPYCLDDGVCAGHHFCHCPQPNLVGEKCQYTKPCVPITMYNFTRVNSNGTISALPDNLRLYGGKASLEGDSCNPTLKLAGGGCVQIPLRDLCYKDLDNCFSGFTISVTVKLDTTPNEKYFLTTGGELGSHSGLAFSYRNGILTVAITMSKRSWLLRKPYNLLPNTWYWFEISWTPNFGLTLRINDREAGYVFQYSKADPTVNVTDTLTVGCSTEVTTPPSSLWIKNLILVSLPHEDLSNTTYTDYANGLTNSTPCVRPPTVEECLHPPTTEAPSTTEEITTTPAPDTTTELESTTPLEETTTPLEETTTQLEETTTPLEETTTQLEETTTPLEETTTPFEETTTLLEELTTEAIEITTEDIITGEPITTTKVETTTESEETTTLELEVTTMEFRTQPDSTPEPEVTTTEVEVITEEATTVAVTEEATMLEEKTTTAADLITEANTSPPTQTLTTPEPTTQEPTTDEQTTTSTTTTTTTTTTTLPTTTIPTTTAKLTTTRAPIAGCHIPLWQTGIIKSVNVVTSSNSPGKTPAMAEAQCCPGPTVGGWCPDPDQDPTAQYIEVTFDGMYGVKAIEIEPPEGTDPFYPAREYMTNYTFSYIPYGGNNQTLYGTSAGPLYLMGVRGNAATVVSTFTEIVGLVTNKVRISVVDFVKEPCFRFDIFGCPPENICNPHCQNGGTCIYENTCACPPPYYGPSCKYSHLPQNSQCLKPLGMWNGDIKDNQLLASSSSPGHSKDKARYICCLGQDKGSWCPSRSDPDPYYEVHLDKPYLVAMIMFQPPSKVNFWDVPDTYLNTFTLQYRNVYLQAMETYAVNIDAIYNASVVFNPTLDPFLLTDVIRIVPSKFTKQACFRFELIGCDPDEGPSPPTNLLVQPGAQMTTRQMKPGVMVGRRRRGAPHP